MTDSILFHKSLVEHVTSSKPNFRNPLPGFFLAKLKNFLDLIFRENGRLRRKIFQDVAITFYYPERA